MHGNIIARNYFENWRRQKRQKPASPSDKRVSPIQHFSSFPVQNSKGDFCLRMHEKVKKVFCFTTFVLALRECAVFGAAEFDNRTFEGELFFNWSSVSHLKHVTVKSNSKWRENCPFHIACSDFTGDKALFVHSCHQQRWHISLQQRWGKEGVNSFLQHSESTTGLIWR